MVCMYCGSPTMVSNSRASSVTKQVWRRRTCKVCKSTFSTFERPDLYKSLVVKYASDKLYPFSKDSLLVSIYESCRHRQSAVLDASALTDTIISKLLKKSRNGTIERAQIVDTASTILKRFDTAANVYYLAYHKP
jgi:transcriptional regulator NrdR family protein